MRLLLVTDSQSATIELDLGLTEARIGAWGGGIVHADPDHVLGYPSNVWGVVSRPVSVGFGNATASSIVFTQSDDIEVYGEKPPASQNRSFVIIFELSKGDCIVDVANVSQRAENALITKKEIMSNNRT